MMIRQTIRPLALALMLSGLAGALPAEPAEPYLGNAVAMLEAQGYRVTDTRRSWLGRLVVLSEKDGKLRELVLDRATGAVLSDRLFPLGGRRDEDETDQGAQPAAQPATSAGDGGNTHQKRRGPDDTSGHG